MRFVALVLFVALGCHHDARPAEPAEPAEQAPLPPSTGTPIGYLIDNAFTLQLSDDQLSQLRGIDADLASKLGLVEKQLRTASKPPPQKSNAPGGGMSGGGMSGGGMRGGGMRGMGGTGGRRPRGGAGSGSARPRNGAIAGRLTAERQRDVLDAIGRAMTVLRPEQQTRAKKIFEDNDIDLDPNAPTARDSATRAEP